MVGCKVRIAKLAWFVGDVFLLADITITPVWIVVGGAYKLHIALISWQIDNIFQDEK